MWTVRAQINDGAADVKLSLEAFTAVLTGDEGGAHAATLSPKLQTLHAFTHPLEKVPCRHGVHVVYIVNNMTEHPVSLRIEEATLRKVDQVAAALSRRAAGADVKRGTVLRLAVEKGLDALEDELMKMDAYEAAVAVSKKRRAKK
jgi:hypothetical protein